MQLRLSAFLAATTFLIAALTACSPSSPAPAHPDELLSRCCGLDLKSLPHEDIEATLQTIDQSTTNLGVEVRVHQTLGDAMTLYVVCTAAFPDGIPQEWASHQLAVLTASDIALPCTRQNVYIEPLDKDTLAFVCSFGFDKERLFPGTEVTLTLRGGTQNDEPNVTTTHVFSWTTENQGKIRYVDIKDEHGRMTGTCSISAFAINATLWNGGSLYSGPEDYLSTIHLFDESGQSVDTVLSQGGGAINGWKQFSTPVNLATVSAVQVGPYLAEFSS